MTEHIAYRFDWDEATDGTITEILGLNAATVVDGAARWDAVAICLGSIAVVVTVEPDTDQVIINREVSPTGNGWRRIASFEFAVAKRLGWSWIGINSRGYKDSFTIAFSSGGRDVLEPRCAFVAQASSLMCFDLMPRRALRRVDQDENAPSNRMRIGRGCGGAGRSPEPT